MINYGGVADVAVNYNIEGNGKDVFIIVAIIVCISVCCKHMMLAGPAYYM